MPCVSYLSTIELAIRALGAIPRKAEEVRSSLFVQLALVLSR